MKKRRIAQLIGLVLLLLATGLWVTLHSAPFGGTASPETLSRMLSAPMYHDGTFSNPEATTVMRADNTFAALRDFMVNRHPMTVPPCPLPMATDTVQRLATPPPTGLRVTWLGHSTTLIEIDGATLLTDPMWSERASPVPFAGPHRFHPPPLPMTQLPHIDAVLISHDHYDHLDMATVQALGQRGATFHVALGVAAHLERWGIPSAQVVEHTWWQEDITHGNVRLISTPSRHFSGRGVLNRNSTLWTSWTVVGPQHRVYFSGDTGITHFFAEVADKFGPLDLAMLEIGQWNENWNQIHLGPHGAAAAHRALSAKHLLPIHWATFELGLHAWSEPPETLLALEGAAQDSVLTPLLGEPIEPTTGQATRRWWRDLPPTAPACPAPEALRPPS